MDLETKNDSKKKLGRPAKKGMSRWLLSIKNNIKEDTQAHLRRLEVTDSDHFTFLLNSVDLSKITTKNEYLKYMTSIQLR